MSRFLRPAKRLYSIMASQPKTQQMIPISDKFPIFTEIAQLQRWRDGRGEEEVGFVPTMGALHEGHLDLVKTSLRRSKTTVVSIFVNPSQFAPHEDLSTYPRTISQDVTLLSSLLPSSSTTSSSPLALFLPSVPEMYPTGISQDVNLQTGAFVEVCGLQSILEGRTRPTFFRGVATVVTKLFNIVRPDVGFFGQKDIQQAILLRRMLLDLRFRFPKELYVCEITREKDGLALSSRNAYLSTVERKHSILLNKALRVGVEEVERLGSVNSSQAKEIKRLMESKVQEGIEEAERDGVQAKLDYLAVCRKDLSDVTTENEEDQIGRKDVILVGAVWVGKTRLIDNLISGWDLNPTTH